MTDRGLLIAFALSSVLHLGLLFTQMQWLFIGRRPPRPTHPIDVIYHKAPPEQELRQLREQLARLKQGTVAAPTGGSISDQTQVRIPDRGTISMEQLLQEHLAGLTGSVVDLTNLVSASHGDPVLLSYFTAIREQLQVTANRGDWTLGEQTQGLVYVSFLLGASGEVQHVQIVADRSAASATLREIATRIVRAASPFPPFPPSIAEPSKTVVVPLEFFLGGS